MMACIVSIDQRTAKGGPLTVGRSSHPPLYATILTLRLLLAAALGAGVTIAHAQEWPAHPVKVIVPYGPGGISDVLARITADRLSKALGKPFIIESRGGAGGPDARDPSE